MIGRLRSAWQATARALRPRWRPRLSVVGRGRRPRPSPLGELPPAVEAARVAALWLMAVIAVTTTTVALSESYRGLYLWASGHLVPAPWSWVWPAMVDTFVVGGEIGVFLAVIYQWGWRDRVYFWAATALGLAASVAGNVGRIHSALLASRGTAAVPPLAAFFMLAMGIRVFKLVLLHGRQRRADGHSAAVDGHSAAVDGHAAAITGHAAAIRAAIAAEEIDVGAVVRAMMRNGVTDTATLVELTDRSERTVRRHKAAAEVGDGQGAEQQQRPRRHAASARPRNGAQLVTVGGE